MIVDPTKKNGTAHSFDWDNAQHIVGALENVANDSVRLADELEGIDQPANMGALLQQLLRVQVVQLRTQASLVRQMVKSTEARNKAAMGIVGARIIPPNGGH